MYLSIHPKDEQKRFTFQIRTIRCSSKISLINKQKYFNTENVLILRTIEYIYTYVCMCWSIFECAYVMNFRLCVCIVCVCMHVFVRVYVYVRAHITGECLWNKLNIRFI